MEIMPSRQSLGTIARAGVGFKVIYGPCPASIWAFKDRCLFTLLEKEKHQLSIYLHELKKVAVACFQKI